MVDLAATTVTDRSVMLTCTPASGHAIAGWRYDLRHAVRENAAWDDMTPAADVTLLGEAEETLTVLVGSLQPSTTYYFRLKIGDGASVWSDESNETSGTRLRSPGPSISPITR